ncbi:hypothetical protein BH23CHL2_BH23CHL2_26050 [soil metagenome]
MAHSDHVLRATRTLLEREHSFDPKTRELFWTTHLGKVSAWCEAMRTALESDDLERSNVGEQRTLGHTIDELNRVLVGARTIDPGDARDNEDAIKALAFSNVIAYMATAYRGTNSIGDQWRIYVNTLERLGIQPGTSVATDSPESINGEFDYDFTASEENRALSGWRRAALIALWIALGFVAGQIASVAVFLSTSILYGSESQEATWLPPIAALAVWVYVGVTGFRGGFSKINTIFRREYGGISLVWWTAGGLLVGSVTLVIVIVGTPNILATSHTVRLEVVGPTNEIGSEVHCGHPWLAMLLPLVHARPDSKTDSKTRAIPDNARDSGPAFSTYTWEPRRGQIMPETAIIELKNRWGVNPVRVRIPVSAPLFSRIQQHHDLRTPAV